MEESEFWAALLGGLLSAVTAMAFFILEKKWAEKKSKQQIGLRKSACTLSVVAKLGGYLGGQFAIKSHFDECFDDAGEINFHETDLADIIVEAVQTENMIELLTSEELALCIESWDTGLMEKLLAVQSRYHSNIRIMNRINEMLIGYKAFKAENAMEGSKIVGNKGITRIPTNSAPRRDIFVSEINSLVGAVYQSIDGDIVLARDSLLRFLTAMKSIDGIKAPNVKIDSQISLIK